MKTRRLIHPVTGQELVFLKTGRETNGQMLEMESLYQGNSPEPPPHYHPEQKETFTILEGEMMARISGVVQELKTGDVLVIEPNTVHSMWNATKKIARLNWKTEPALQTEAFFRTLFGLAIDGKAKPSGTPGLLQAALLMRRFVHEFRPARPPFAVQKVLFGILAPIARLQGLRSHYPEYLEDGL